MVTPIKPQQNNVTIKYRGSHVTTNQKIRIHGYVFLYYFPETVWISTLQINPSLLNVTQQMECILFHSVLRNQQTFTHIKCHLPNCRHAPPESHYHKCGRSIAYISGIQQLQKRGESPWTDVKMNISRATSKIKTVPTLVVAIIMSWLIILSRQKASYYQVDALIQENGSCR